MSRVMIDPDDRKEVESLYRAIVFACDGDDFDLESEIDRRAVDDLARALRVYGS